MSKTICLLLVLTAAAIIYPIGLHAQALPTGTISVSQLVYACSAATNGSLFYPNMTCQNATVSCPNTASINLTFGALSPQSPLGTIVFFSGGDGTTPTQSGDDILTYATAYSA
jgi:hypothetical protein